MKANTTVEHPQTVTFTRLKAQDCLPGASLWFPLPGITCDQVKQLFGTGLASQRKEKYSRAVVIQSSASGRLYSLYMSFGEWRIGAIKTNEVDKRALLKLFE